MSTNHQQINNDAVLQNAIRTTAYSDAITADGTIQILSKCSFRDLVTWSVWGVKSICLKCRMQFPVNTSKGHAVGFKFWILNMVVA